MERAVRDREDAGSSPVYPTGEERDSWEKTEFLTTTEGAARWLATCLENMGIGNGRRSTRPPSSCRIKTSRNKLLIRWHGVHVVEMLGLLNTVRVLTADHGRILSLTMQIERQKSLIRSGDGQQLDAMLSLLSV